MNSENNKEKATSDPLLSVVMATYNNGKYLYESIESVLSQTYARFEFIIINDGSYDNSESIIQEFAKKDKRIIYIKNAVNLGQSEARNKAIKVAKGNFIVIVDSDDICPPDRFEKQVRYFRKNPDTDILGSSYCLFLNASPEQCKAVVSADSSDIHDGKPPVHNPTCMMKRSLFADYGYYDSNYDHAEDVELWFRWFSQGVRFENMPEVLYKKRLHAGSVSVFMLKRQVYLMFKINLIALIKYHIRFNARGYRRVLEQFLYLVYLFFGLNKIYVKGNKPITNADGQ